MTPLPSLTELRARLAAMTEEELESELSAVRAAIEWKRNQRKGV